MKIIKRHAQRQRLVRFNITEKDIEKYLMDRGKKDERFRKFKILIKKQELLKICKIIEEFPSDKQHPFLGVINRKKLLLKIKDENKGKNKGNL